MHTFDTSGFGTSSHEKRAHAEFSDQHVRVGEGPAAIICQIPRDLLRRFADAGEIPFQGTGSSRSFSIADCNALRERLLAHSQQPRPVRRHWFDAPQS